MQIARLHIVDLCVVLTLGIALFASIWTDNTELSTSITSGLLGYLGGVKLSSQQGF